MSYVEAIEYQSPMQIRAHRERMERLRRLGGVPTPRQVISFRRKPVAVVIEAQKEEEQVKPAAESVFGPVLIVSGVNITACPAVGLVTMTSVKKIPIAGIQRLVCARYGISMKEMNGRDRPARIVMPRQMAMYLCRKATSRSLPEIGRKFGGRDHTTVLHAVCKIESMMSESPEFANEVQAIAKTVESGAWA